MTSTPILELRRISADIPADIRLTIRTHKSAKYWKIHHGIFLVRGKQLLRAFETPTAPARDLAPF